MTHRGILEFRTGARLELEYTLTTPATGGVVHGSLCGNFLAFDPTLLAERIQLACDDGLKLQLLITHQSGRGATFIGTIIQNGHYIPDAVAMGSKQPTC